ncbi:MAG: helix-turn-helix transcriptional regulator [Clostridium sp.]|nr:helix-turn-helix transcriptional regulator [Clostridium sp.]
MNKKDVGRKIKEFRNLAGLTQAELAEAVHMHEKQISRIEAGVHFPTFDNFVKILEVLDVEMKDFDLSLKIEKNSLRKKALKIIQRANNKELVFYVSMLETLHKCIKQENT